MVAPLEDVWRIEDVLGPRNPARAAKGSPLSSPMVVTEAATNRPDIRVVLASAHSPEMIASAVSSPQICAFIRKPYQLRNLISGFRNVLSRQGMDSRLNNRISA